MDPVFHIGQKVAVEIGGCAENRTEGVVRSVQQLPQLTTYEVHFPEFRTQDGVPSYYMAEALTPLG